MHRIGQLLIAAFNKLLALPTLGHAAHSLRKTRINHALHNHATTIVEHLHDVPGFDSTLGRIFGTDFVNRLGIELFENRRVEPLRVCAPTRVLLNECDWELRGRLALLAYLCRRLIVDQMLLGKALFHVLTVIDARCRLFGVELRQTRLGGELCTTNDARLSRNKRKVDEALFAQPVERNIELLARIRR